MDKIKFNTSDTQANIGAPRTNDNSDYPLPDDIPFTENYSTPMYGWICPKCGAVLSPWVNQCPNCRPKILNNTYQDSKDPNIGFGTSVSTNVVNGGENTSRTQGKVITDYTTNFTGKPLYD